MLDNVAGDELWFPLFILVILQVVILDDRRCLCQAKKFAALLELFLVHSCIITVAGTSRHAKQAQRVLIFQG